MAAEKAVAEAEAAVAKAAVAEGEELGKEVAGASPRPAGEMRLQLHLAAGLVGRRLRPCAH